VKASAILVQPVAPLDALPPAELDVVRRFLFQHMRGLDAEHDRRWRRFWARIVNGEVAQFYPVVDRSGAFHARHMAIEGRIFENQDAFVQLRPFRDWLKTGAAFGTWQIVDGQHKFVPSSLSYEDCSDDEMRQFHQDAMDYLHTPHALRRLWPHLNHARRLEMLETLLHHPHQE
jgi:hypothetical protein